MKIETIKKLSKQRRKFYIGSSLNITHINRQLAFLTPILDDAIDKIKYAQQKQALLSPIKETAQIFEYVKNNNKKKAAIYALDYLIFCFSHGCCTIKKFIRRELMFLLERINHFIAYELKEIIQPSTFFCFNFLKALKKHL
ncbi:hypothetical protein ACS3LV_000862 [Proteus mirabilis]